MREGIIYSVTNLVTGHMYIGQTIRPLDVRWKRHKKDARLGSEVPLHRAIRKHGVGNFHIEKLCSVPVDWLNAVEAAFVRLLGTFGNGYNATAGGDGFEPGELHPLFGKKRPAEVCKKISETRIRLGIRHDAETLERMGRNRKGKKLKLSPERRLEMREAFSGERNPMFGKPISLEHREKLRDSHLGKMQSPETLAKRSKAMAGKKFKESSSSFCGVSKSGRASKWQARLRVNGKNVCLGTYFTTEVEAAQAYNNYVREHGLDRPLNVFECALPLPLAA